MRFKAGYKYQLHKEEFFKVKIFPLQDIDTQFIGLTEHGVLTVKAGYAWDGASGPTIDTKSAMRGSLAHDALYQLMREKKISSVRNRKRADLEFKRIIRQDGMNRLRAWAWYHAVRIGAKNSSENGRPILEAP